MCTDMVRYSSCELTLLQRAHRSPTLRRAPPPHPVGLLRNGSLTGSYSPVSERYGGPARRVGYVTVAVCRREWVPPRDLTERSTALECIPAVCGRSAALSGSSTVHWRSCNSLSDCYLCRRAEECGDTLSIYPSYALALQCPPPVLHIFLVTYAV